MKPISNVPHITSRNNDAIAFAAKLKEKKYRRESGLFVFEGIKLLEDAVKSGTVLHAVYVTEKAYSHFEKELDACGVESCLTVVSDPVYEKLSLENAPQGVFCVARLPEKRKEAAAGGFSVLLDHVGDPGNLGAVLRSADAFGARAVYLSEGCADLYNPKTVRACMGSLFRVYTETDCDLVPMMGELRKAGQSVYAAMLDESAKRPSELGELSVSAGVIGNEGSGVPDEVRAACTGAVYIPMRENGPQSLNASVAAGILMWEC
ncbi:MAG: RNA methyltransferase, partial [Ruminococcus sp.]|nr:RNA methyltransferase [Candidatus Apopatosoma intestinale]